MAEYKLYQFCMPKGEAAPSNDQLDIWREAAMGKIARAIEAEFYKEIATVSAGSLEEVFRLTNSIDSNWTDGDQVEMAVMSARSSMVGDVVYDIEGDRLMLCAPFGWEELGPDLEEAFRLQLALYQPGRHLPF